MAWLDRRHVALRWHDGQSVRAMQRRRYEFVTNSEIAASQLSLHETQIRIAMKPDDPNSQLDRRARSWDLPGKMYLPLFVQGLTTTAKHLFSRKVTRQFPEERPKIGNPLIYRGVHRLEQGRAGPGEVRGLFPVRHGLPGPLHRHRRRRKAPGPTAKSIPRAFRSTSCAASTAACAKRPARSMRSS